jgi:hypothetical protein
MTIHDDILAEADKIIAGDRRVDYGDVTDSFVALASLWTWYLKTKFKVDFELTGIDVAMIMTLMKVSRGTTGAAKRDNLVDICGYAALGARFMAVDKKPVASIDGHLEKQNVNESLKKASQHTIAFIPDAKELHIDPRNRNRFVAYPKMTQFKAAEFERVYSIRFREKAEGEPDGAGFPYQEGWMLKVESSNGMLFIVHRRLMEAQQEYTDGEKPTPSVCTGPVRILYEVLP